MVKEGDAVEFFDPYGTKFDALVTNVFGGPGITYPSVNVVFASGDESKKDPYGRQLERYTSVVHRTNQYAHGMYWRGLNEVDE